MSWWSTSSGAPRPVVRSRTEEPATRTSSVVHARAEAVGVMVATLSNRPEGRKPRGRSGRMKRGRRLRLAQPALPVEEREGRPLVADHADVAHEARVRAEPQVQRARGRLHHHREALGGPELERDLVRG